MEKTFGGSNEKIWKPDVVLYNNANPWNGMHQFSFNVVISPYGNIVNPRANGIYS